MGNFKFHSLKRNMRILCCINRFTSLCKILLNLLEFLAEAFRCHVHHFQCLTVPVELNDAHGIEKLLLKMQVSWTSSCIMKRIYQYNILQCKIKMDKTTCESWNSMWILLFYPSWSCTIICCVNIFTWLCKNLFNLLAFLAEVFRCHVHHF